MISTLTAPLAHSRSSRAARLALLALLAAGLGAEATAQDAPLTAHPRSESGEGTIDEGALAAATSGGRVTRGLAGDEVGRLVESGRSLLADGRPDQALVLFEEAVAQDGGTPRTRMWIARAWMAQDRINDALDLSDDLATAGFDGPDLDYLYGMGFWHKAGKNRRTGADLSVVDMLYQDALGYLQRATASDAERYRDAWYPLAESAWLSQELALARRAAERAAELEPKSVDARFLLGRIALSQQKTAADAGRAEDAAASLARAVDAFERATALLGKPRAAEERGKLADTWVQLGYARVWQEAPGEAADAFAQALGWAPERVDVGTVRGFFDAERFRACLERGAELFARRHGARATEDATLRWWLGWSRFAERDYAGAEKAFVAAVEKRADFVNTWVYVALSRYHQRDFSGAIEALTTGWKADEGTVVTELSRDAKLNLAILDYLVGRAFQQGDLLTAAELSRIQAEMTPREAKYWNNTGLFYRDGGEALAASSSKEKGALAADCYERAYAAYSRALALRPEDPALLNDTAVVLHYYLNRDLDRARTMYANALRFAERELARPDLPSDERELYRIARRDARNNLTALDGRRGDSGPPPR